MILNYIVFIIGRIVEHGMEAWLQVLSQDLGEIFAHMHRRISESLQDEDDNDNNSLDENLQDCLTELTVLDIFNYLGQSGPLTSVGHGAWMYIKKLETAIYGFSNS